MVAVVMEATMGKRARNRARTRQALIGAAHELFAERGFDDVRVDDIAARAGIGRRTFFRYFATKAEVAFPDHHERIARFESLVSMRLPNETPLAAVQRSLVVLGSEMMAASEAVLAQQAIVDASPALLAAERILDREWDARIAQALAEGDQPDTRDKIIAGAVLGAIRAAMRAWFDSGGEGDLVEIGLGAFALLDAGLASEHEPVAKSGT